MSNKDKAHLELDTELLDKAKALLNSESFKALPNECSFEIDCIENEATKKLSSEYKQKFLTRIEFFPHVVLDFRIKKYESSKTNNELIKQTELLQSTIEDITTYMVNFQS